MFNIILRAVIASLKSRNQLAVEIIALRHPPHIKNPVNQRATGFPSSASRLTDQLTNGRRRHRGDDLELR